MEYERTNNPDKEKRILTIDEALSLIVEGEDVHTFYPTSTALLGANWTRLQIVRALEHATCIELAGENAQEMNHAVAIHENNGITVFIETDPTNVAALIESDAIKQQQNTQQ